jgi:hypothetical protein
MLFVYFILLSYVHGQANWDNFKGFWGTFKTLDGQNIYDIKQNSYCITELVANLNNFATTVGTLQFNNTLFTSVLGSRQCTSSYTEQSWNLFYWVTSATFVKYDEANKCYWWKYKQNTGCFIGPNSSYYYYPALFTYQQQMMITNGIWKIGNPGSWSGSFLCDQCDRTICLNTGCK